MDKVHFLTERMLQVSGPTNLMIFGSDPEEYKEQIKESTMARMKDYSPEDFFKMELEKASRSLDYLKEINNELYSLREKNKALEKELEASNIQVLELECEVDRLKKLK